MIFNELSVIFYWYIIKRTLFFFQLKRLSISNSVGIKSIIEEHFFI